MSKEAMKLALEALENSVDLVREDAYQAEKLYGNYPTRQGKVGGLKVLADDHEKAITALREALAEQPAQQEPVAWKNAAIRLGEELSSVGPDGYYYMTAEQWLDWAMDQRPKGKNSLPAQQEPVTWGVDWGKAGDIPCVAIIKRLPGGGIEVVAVEYAPYEYNPPAQRTWVGLTDEEIERACVPLGAAMLSFTEVARAIEAKLKEKNT